MKQKAEISEIFVAVLPMQAGPIQPLHSWYSTPMSQAASLHDKDKGKRRRFWSRWMLEGGQKAGADG